MCEAQNLLATWRAPTMKHGGGNEEKSAAAAAAGKHQKQKRQALGNEKVLKIPIIKAGTIAYAVLDTTVIVIILIRLLWLLLY